MSELSAVQRREEEVMKTITATYEDGHKRVVPGTLIPGTDGLLAAAYWDSEWTVCHVPTGLRCGSLGELGSKSAAIRAGRKFWESLNQRERNVVAGATEKICGPLENGLGKKAWKAAKPEKKA